MVAVLALYRPGPLGSGMVDSYVRRKHDEEDRSPSLTRSIEPILADTLGVILYQEQVMRIASTLMSGLLAQPSPTTSGRPWARRSPEILAEVQEAKFVEGATENEVSEANTASEEMFDLIEYFAGYGFNKSHSVAYAMITYQTGWLKANHPVEYMAALLSCEMSSIEKTVEYNEKCKERGIEVLPPDVNHSRQRFTVEDGKIRFALAALRGVGEKALDPLVAARDDKGPFRSLFDLCERVDVHKLNKGAMEALILAGAMDDLPGNRAQKISALDDALAIGSAAAKDRASGQGSLFGMLEEPDNDEQGVSTDPPFQDLPEFSEKDRLQKEKDVLGFYLTGHPLNEVRDTVKRFSNTSTNTLSKLKDKAEIVLGGIVSKVRIVVIRKGQAAPDRKWPSSVSMTSTAPSRQSSSATSISNSPTPSEKTSSASWSARSTTAAKLRA